MWELDSTERWLPNNWCFWTTVLEKTLESPLDCKEIQSVHSKGDQPWVFFGRADATAETLILWPPNVKNWLTGKDPDAGRVWGQEKGMTEDEMAGWHHWLDGCESQWTPGVGDGQGGLALRFMGLQRVGLNWATDLISSFSWKRWWSVPPPPAATFWGSWNSVTYYHWTSHLALEADFIKVSFFDLHDFDWFGSWGPWLQNIL